MEDFENWMWLVWTGILVVSLIAEAATAALLSIWFVAGAAVALIFSFIPGIPYWVELIIFFGVSLLVFFLIRPFLKKLMHKRISKSNVDSIVGKKGAITEDTSALNPGEVSVASMIWTALPAKSTMTLPKGTIVQVVAVEGNKLIVKPFEEEA